MTLNGARCYYKQLKTIWSSTHEIVPSFFFWAEALDWAPPIPGPRREGVSPPCRAHSAHALIHFPISTPQAPPNKP